MTETTGIPLTNVQTLDLPVTSKKHFLVRIWSLFESLTGQGAGTNSRRARGWTGKLKRFLPAGIGILLLVIILNIIVRRVQSGNTSGSAGQQLQQTSTARKSTQINRVFEFPILDQGKEVTRFSYTVESAELRDQIIVQGKPMSTIEGKTFLIVTIKIQNAYNKAINVNARDYIRLSVNGNTAEQVAADIHNDTVNIQPISTKTTRIGFPVNITDTRMSLTVGEIDGSKETLTLDL